MKSALTAPPAPTKKPKFKQFNISFEDLVRRDVQRTEDKRRLRLQRNLQKSNTRDYWLDRLEKILSEKLGAA